MPAAGAAAGVNGAVRRSTAFRGRNRDAALPSCRAALLSEAMPPPAAGRAAGCRTPAFGAAGAPFDTGRAEKRALPPWLIRSDFAAAGAVACRRAASLVRSTVAADFSGDAPAAGGPDSSAASFSPAVKNPPAASSAAVAAAIDTTQQIQKSRCLRRKKPATRWDRSGSTSGLSSHEGACIGPEGGPSSFSIRFSASRILLKALFPFIPRSVQPAACSNPPAQGLRERRIG